MLCCTKVNNKISFLLVSFALIILVEGITFEQDINLTLEQKKLLDKVRLQFEKLCMQSNFFNLIFVLQFKDRVVDKLPHDYMKKEIYLIKWLRSEIYISFHMYEHISTCSWLMLFSASNFNIDIAEERLYRVRPVFINLPVRVFMSNLVPNDQGKFCKACNCMKLHKQSQRRGHMFMMCIYFSVLSLI